MRKNSIDFKLVSKELNGFIQDIEYSHSDLKTVFETVGLPVCTEYRNQLVECCVLASTKKGIYKFVKIPVHYMDLERAYKHTREKLNKYAKKTYNIKKIESNEISTNDVEIMIQNAIKLLKAQGDRFTITEKVVTITYKDL